MHASTRFTVYNASAGSGKTFQIASQYLGKILRATDRSYIYRLLGITFTNKAAEEMKLRIIHTLIEAAQGRFNDVMEAVSRDLKNEIQRQTGITDEKKYRREIIDRSQKRLFEILHYYDEFQLTTIDKLMYKIIRTFARDMQLPVDVGVELDYKEVVNNLIDKLINQAPKGSLLSQALIDMAKRLTDDEKSWDIKKNLSTISSIIFDDNYFDEIKSLEYKTLEDFQALKTNIYARRKQLYQNLSQKYLTGLKRIFPADRSLINKYLGNHLEKYILNPEAFHSIKLTESQRNNVNNQAKIYKKDYLDAHSAENDLLKTFFRDLQEAQSRYKVYTSVIDNLNALSVINELNKEIEQFKAENNLVFIHDFNHLIKENLLADLSGDTPYIYMRMGEKYGHIFIDEFQDTSALQWQNLIPLVKESLSKEFANNEAGTSIVVGDAKQSIYRFRGGKPEQFIALSNPEDNSSQGNPFARITAKNVENLAYNWRSQANIIRFNNAFFSTFPDYFNGPYQSVYQSVYQARKVNQKIPPGKDKNEGFVQVRFYNEKGSKKQEKEDYSKLVLKDILQAQKNGYQPDEICILVDRNTHGIKISETLIENGIDVVSSESLLVGQASKVKLLLSVLHFLDSGQPADLYEAVRYIAGVHQLDKPDVYANFFKDRLLSKSAYLKKFEEWGYVMDYNQLMQFNLYDLAVYLTEIFQLTDDTREYAYLQAFLEKIYDFQTKNETHIRGFLRDWSEIEAKYSIKAPKKQGAVQVMSVHKSKGLEFPVVIYYTQGELFSSMDAQNNTWIPVNPEEYNGFKYLPVQIGKLADSPVPELNEIYQRVTSEKIFDNMNRLYVALTRAVDQLYVVLPQIPQKEGKLRFNNIFHNFLQKTDYQVGENLYQFGYPQRTSKTDKQAGSSEKINRLMYRLWHIRKQKMLHINTLSFERWQESKKNAINYGLQLHEILSQIETRPQWQEHKDRLLSNIPTTEKQQVERLIERLLNHPDLKPYYTTDYQILNEHSILIPTTRAYRQKRPDRLLLKDGKAIIIDYKTGEPHAYHRRQLDEYAVFLQEAGWETEKKILVYIDGEKIKPETF